MKNPSLIEFIKSAGLLGAGSVALSIALYVITVREHIDKNNVPAAVFFVLACLAFCYGAHLAWRTERKKHIETESLFNVAQIRGKILRASIDTKIYKNGEWQQLDNGIALTMLVEAVNHSQVDAWYGNWPTIDISFGAETLPGTSIDLPHSQYVLVFDDPTFTNKLMSGLFHSVSVGGPDWLPGRPRYGYLSFAVSGIDQNIMKQNEITASICLHLYDSLGRDHQIRAEKVGVAKGLVKDYVPPPRQA